MSLMINELVDDLYKILTTTTANNRYYSARALGFRSELEFVREFIKKRADFMTGGKFLFFEQNSAASAERKLPYITISPDSPENYVLFYNKLMNFPLCGEMFFLQHSMEINKWKRIDFEMKNESGQNIVSSIFEPDYQVYKFNGKKFSKTQINEILNLLPDKAIKSCVIKDKSVFTYLRKYSIDELSMIYADRYFIDVLLRKKANSLSDFDGIWVNGHNYVLIEMKEKDPGPKDRILNKIPKEKWFFGWDTRRLSWYLYIVQSTGLNVMYAIREVDNQKERNFIGWKYLYITDFARSAEWLSRSGGGGKSETTPAPYLKFKDLTSLINS